MDRNKKWSSIEVRDLRYKLGWSQAEFARHLGCTHLTVSAWEEGFARPEHHHSRLMTKLEGLSDTYTVRIKCEAFADALIQDQNSSQISHTEVVKHLHKTL